MIGRIGRATALAVIPLLWSAYAAAAPPERRVIPKRVTVVDVRALPADRPLLLAPGVPEQAVVVPGGLAVAFLEQLRAQPEFVGVDWASVQAGRAAQPSVREGERLARASLQIGIQQYRNLLVDQAADTLERAATLIHDHLVDLHDPEVAASLYLHLGLVQLERGRHEEARAALRNFYFYAPTRSFQQGFFPPGQERALQSVRADFLRLSPLSQLSASRQAAGLLHQRTGLDHAVTLVWNPRAPGEVAVRITDLRRGTPVLESLLPLAPDGAPDAEALDRLVSRFVACEVFEREAPVDPHARHKRAFIEADFGYLTYFEHPTRSLFHNLSVGVTAGKGFSRYFGALARVGLLSSIEDRDRDLADRLVSVRAVLAAEFRLPIKRLLLYFSPGLELHVLPGFTVLTSAECKFFGADHPQCASANVKPVAAQTVAGLSGAMGFRLDLTADLYLGLSAQTAIYLVPFNRGNNLDFPFTGQFAIGFHL